MQTHLTRRSVMGAIGVLSLSVGTSFANNSDIREFMNAALDDINKNGRKIGPPTTKMHFDKIPKIIPFGDWDFYYLDNLLLWGPNTGQNVGPVIVPKGFVTDLASVPSFLWSVFPRTGRYAYAAIVHDYLYWFQPVSREEADKVLSAAMQDAKVPAATITSFSAALKAAGSVAWSSNAQARRAGEKRVLAKFPDDPLVSWADWKKQPGVFQP